MKNKLCSAIVENDRVVRANSTGKRDDDVEMPVPGGGSRSCKRAKVTRAVTNVQKTLGPPDESLHTLPWVEFAAGYLMRSRDFLAEGARADCVCSVCE